MILLVSMVFVQKRKVLFGRKSEKEVTHFRSAYLTLFKYWNKRQEDFLKIIREKYLSEEFEI